jgi:hypothetical protein
MLLLHPFVPEPQPHFYATPASLRTWTTNTFLCHWRVTPYLRTWELPRCTACSGTDNPAGCTCRCVLMAASPAPVGTPVCPDPPRLRRSPSRLQICCNCGHNTQTTYTVLTCAQSSRNVIINKEKCKEGDNVQCIHINKAGRTKNNEINK